MQIARGSGGWGREIDILDERTPQYVASLRLSKTSKAWCAKCRDTRFVSGFVYSSLFYKNLHSYTECSQFKVPKTYGDELTDVPEVCEKQQRIRGRYNSTIVIHGTSIPTRKPNNHYINHTRENSPMHKLCRYSPSPAQHPTNIFFCFDIFCFCYDTMSKAASK